MGKVPYCHTAVVWKIQYCFPFFVFDSDCTIVLICEQHFGPMGV